MARRDGIEHVADVHARHRARGAAQLAGTGVGEGDHRPTHTILQAAGHQSDHALVPARIVETEPMAAAAPAAVAVRIAQVTHGGDRLLLHPALDRTALLVQLVEARRERQRLGRRVGEQATDADRHVIEAPRRIEPRPGGETEVGGHEARQRALAGLEQRPHARRAATGPDALQPLRHQHTVVVVERHDVGDGPERDEVQPSGRRRQRRIVERAMQRRHHVERDAHPGEATRTEGRAGDVRVHDDVGVGQYRAGEVMVGDQHVDAALAGRGDTRDAGDAVVHGHDQRGRARGRQVDDLGRESVAVLEAVGHEEIDLGPAPRAQRPHDERGTGRAVGIEITDHEHSAVGSSVCEQQGHRIRDALERTHTQQPVERMRELPGSVDAACRIGAGQYRRQGPQTLEMPRIHRPVDDLELHATPSSNADKRSRSGRQNR